MALFGYTSAWVVAIISDSADAALIAGVFSLIGVGMQVRYSRKTLMMPRENKVRIEETRDDVFVAKKIADEEIHALKERIHELETTPDIRARRRAK